MGRGIYRDIDTWCIAGNRCFTSKVLIFFIILSFLFSTLAQAQRKHLTYQQVFERGELKLLGLLPQMRGWLDDNHYLQYYSDPAKDISRLVKVHAKTGKATTFIDYQALNNRFLQGFDLKHHVAKTDDYTGFILRKNNDLYYFSTKVKQIKKLSDNANEEKNPTFSPNGRYVAFTRDKNLFVIDVQSGLEKQLTYDGSDTIYNGWAAWVYYEEILRRASFYKAFWWAPNSRLIAFMRFDESHVPEYPLLRSEDIHCEIEWQRYPKAGDPIPYVKLGIYNLESDETMWIELDQSSEHYIALPKWSWDSSYLLFQWKNREQNNLKIFKLDLSSKKTYEIYNEKQASWVEFIKDNNFYLFKNGSGFLFRSDKDNWYNLYYYDLSGKLINQVTKGNWYVDDIAFVDEGNEVIYFHGALENKTEKHLYRIDYDGDKLKKLTEIPGSHDASFSPQCNYFYDRLSTISHPLKIDLFTIRGEHIRKIGDEKLKSLDSYLFGKAELFTIPTADGFDLPALWILPPKFRPSHKYPVIFFVYGGPDDRKVLNEFQSFGRYFLAQNDIIPITIDNRGSGYFGKKGMAYMHRNLGRWEMNDLIAAVKWLKNLSFIDSTKIGITGSSYGGYTTCMALTYAADYFTHGIALYAVTDWRLYDAIYTERYMDKPDDNPSGYKFGSVMTHADKYRGKLLLVHGTLDDNVHLQNTIQLVDRLQDLNKSFEVMFYINTGHGTAYPKNQHLKRLEMSFWFRHFLNRELFVEE